jgi:hypothetical protein
MIFHFLRADFVTFRIYWVFLIIAELIIHFGTAIGLSDGLTTTASTYVCFLFGLLPLAHIIGSRYRTQQYMSRSYLLSLPIERGHLFNILQIRSFVYWTPMLFELIISMISSGGIELARSKSIFYTFCLFTLACCGLVWFINNQIRTHLNVENISSYLKMDQRMLSWVKLIFSTLIEVCFFGFAASIGEFIGLPWFTFAIPAAMILAWLSYSSARKRWIMVG